MTTKVTVDAHAGWDVEVTVLQLNEAKEIAESRVETVLKNTTKDFYIHSHMKLADIKEMP